MVQRTPALKLVWMQVASMPGQDLQELAAVLEPFLSPEGTIAPYGPTNTLIIRDRLSVVEQLSTAIKGKSCIAESDLE